MPYNHAVTLAFEVVSEDFYGDDITPEMLKAALIKRIESMDKTGEWAEACLPPYDTHKVTQE